MALAFSVGFAAEDYWPRSYFASVGFGLSAARGDVGDYTLSVKNDGVKETVHLPTLDFIASPEIQIGANIREFTLGLIFNYWSFEENLGGFPTEDYMANTKYIRFGFEFTYNLFWPEDFQVGFGLGYYYNTVKTDNSVYSSEPDTKPYGSELMGSSIALIGNIHYFFTPNISLVPIIKIHETWFRFIYTDTEESETSDLKHTQWETVVTAGIQVQFQF